MERRKFVDAFVADQGAVHVKEGAAEIFKRKTGRHKGGIALGQIRKNIPTNCLARVFINCAKTQSVFFAKKPGFSGKRGQSSTESVRNGAGDHQVANGASGSHNSSLKKRMNGS